MSSILDFEQGGWKDLAGLSTFLNGLTHEQRVSEIQKITGQRRQVALYDALKGFRALDVKFFVPDNVPSLKPVHHIGWNSMPPGVRAFEKIMLRPADGSQEMWGFNEGRTRPLIGPGYFILEDCADVPGEVDVNYYKVPDKKPIVAWPEVKPNTSGLQMLVYANMIDRMRGISDHVTLGRAIRKGKLTNNCFFLVRKDG